MIIIMYPLVIEHGYRKSPFLRGKTSISGPCSINGVWNFHQLIGLKDKLQENPIEIMGTSMVSGSDFP